VEPMIDDRDQRIEIGDEALNGFHEEVANG
jgi:hypothetical protein